MSALEKTGEPVKLADMLEVVPGEGSTATEPGDPQDYRALVGLFGAEDGPNDVSANHDACPGSEMEQDYQEQMGRER